MPQPIVHRRRLLQAATFATTLGPLASWAAKPEKPMGYIDAHSHIWTRDVKRFPLAQGKTVADLAPPSFTDDELLKVARPAGVDRVVLIAHSIYYAFDNSYLIAAAKRRPETFRVVAMIDDAGPKPGQQMRDLLPQHVTGFRITPRRRGREKWLDNPGMRSMWKTAAETRQAMCCLINPEDLPAVDTMCAQNPETPVVIDHFGRVGIDGTIREQDLRTLCRLARHPQVHVKISAYYALGKKKPPYRDLLPMIKRVYEAYGADRLMWASDSPYQVVDGHSYQASVDLVANAIDFVTAEERAALLGKTAERVYYYQ